MQPGFIMGVTGLLLATATRLSAFEASGTLLKVDADGRRVQLHANGQDRTVPLADDLKVLGAQGTPLAGGLQAADLKAGAEVTVTVERGPNGPAIHAIRLGGRPVAGASGVVAPVGRTSTGLKPLTEMTADDRYKGEDGGLYGGGRNDPPPILQAAAEHESARIKPLDADGNPSSSGVIGLVSISMSNATMEYARFKELADADPRKSAHVAIVDCAQGGQAMAQWVDPQAHAWLEADRRLQKAGVSPRQVEVIWVKLANVRPAGELADHGRILQHDTLKVVQNAKARFPNLRIAYLGSRIYAGYASTPLNPEPYAYEGALAARWLIQDQMRGAPELAWNDARGPAQAPLLLWGPYFWADGTTPRKADGLVWEPRDFGADGTHPSPAGRDKVARQLLEFFTGNPLARTWFAAP